MNIVTDRIVVGKIFNLEIFIVNRSRHIRRYTLVVPNRKRAKGSDPSQGSKVLPPLPSGEHAAVQNVPIDPYMEEPELLRRHVDNETTEADIICLENNVRLRYAPYLFRQFQDVPVSNHLSLFLIAHYTH